MKRLLVLVAAWLAMLAGSAAAFAHDPGLSSANVELGRERIEITLTFNQRDVASIPAATYDLLGRAITVELDGVALKPTQANVRTDENQNVEFWFNFPRPAGTKHLTLRSLLLKDLPLGHRQALTIRDADGKEFSQQLLSADASTASSGLEESDQGVPGRSRFLEFLALGIRHILTGYDHLLFLFGLLVVCERGRTAALLITCFTAAHSLTLALSTFGLVNLPSRFIEAAIAASILYVGVENIIRRDRRIRGRALLTFVFGLVHGLGFASVLREMGVANSGSAAVIPLVAFNSGVELGQLSVAAIILPLIWFLRRKESFLRIGIPACSLIVALAGGYWLVDRTLLW